METYVKPVSLLVDGERTATPLAKFDMLTGHILCRTSNKCVSFKFERFEGARLEINFDLGHVLIDGRPLHLQGRIPLLEPWYIPKFPLFLADDISRGEQFCMGFVDRFDDTETGAPLRNYAARMATYLFAALTSPPGLLSLEKLKPYLALTCISWFVDDNFSGQWGRGVSGVEAAHVASILCRAVEGETLDEKEIGMLNIPNLRGLWKAYAELRALIFEQAETHEDFERVIRLVTDWTEATGWETQGWPFLDDGKRTDLNITAYLAMRTRVVGFECSLEFIVLAAQVRLNRYVRRDTLFRYLLDKYAHLCILKNDIVSLKKELEAGEKENFVFLMQNWNGTPPEKVLATVLNEYMPALVKEISKTEKMLMAKFGGDSALEEYLRLARRTYDGFVFWSLNTERYIKKGSGERVEVVLWKP